MLTYIILCYLIILLYIILSYIILYYILFYSILLYFILLYCIILYCIISCYIVLYYIILYDVILYYVILYYIIHYIYIYIFGLKPPTNHSWPTGLHPPLARGGKGGLMDKPTTRTRCWTIRCQITRCEWGRPKGWDRWSFGRKVMVKKTYGEYVDALMLIFGWYLQHL